MSDVEGSILGIVLGLGIVIFGEILCWIFRGDSGSETTHGEEIRV